MIFSFGKKQKLGEIDLDSLFTDLQTVLKKHPVVPLENIDTLITEWINDILFLKGMITEKELEEASEEMDQEDEEENDSDEDEE